MNSIEKGVRNIVYANEKLQFVDIFVDGVSFELFLKATYESYFKTSRYQEIQIPILAGMLDDKSLNQVYIDSLNPSLGINQVSPLYGCADGCCLHIFVEIENNGQYIIWKNIGLYSCPIDQFNEDNDLILWLPHFIPLNFLISDYLAFYESFIE